MICKLTPACKTNQINGNFKMFVRLTGVGEVGVLPFDATGS